MFEDYISDQIISYNHWFLYEIGNGILLNVTYFASFEKLNAWSNSSV
jgi:hypothetical protein